jgi:hypothetical protein
MSWDKDNVYFDKIPSKKTVEFSFKWLGGDIKVTNINASCGCTVPEWNPITKELNGKFTPEKVPEHKTYQNLYVAVKVITIKAIVDGEPKVFGLGIHASIFDEK